MSGIVGIFNRNATPVDGDLLSRMIDLVSDRGPDAEASFIDQNAGIGLGHTLLRTTWESQKEQQPFTIDGQTWITADARIDARFELLETLGKTCKYDQITDAELILAAYQSWGEKCVDHLLGDFAFAIWDGRAKSLFCARDHFGVKPFFFAHLNDSFIFSNTLNAIRLDDRVSDELNEVAIGDYLLFGLNQDLSTTIFLNIQRLRPGHTLTVTRDAIKTRRYWTPTIKEEIRFRDSVSYVDCFRELLSQAIEDRLRTNRISISMSGGLDSTSLAAIAQTHLETDAIHAFSIVYDTLIPDQERHYSNIAATYLGIPITHINADGYSLFEVRAPGDLAQAEPFLLSPLGGQFHDLLRNCADFGRVAFTGYDGDSFMTEPPNSYFAACARGFRIKDLALGMSSYARTQKRIPPIGLRKNLKRIFQNQPVLSYPNWIEESFAKRINLRERLHDSLKVATDEIRPSAFQTLDSKVWAALFEGYDPGATKLPLEVRHPFIDLRLVDYLLSIPAVPWCVNKHILRRAMKDLLPQTVVKRTKTPLAGDPPLQLVRRASVRCLDNFEVNSKLRCFINIDARQSVSNESTPEGLSASLRVFALNYWLTNSQPMKSTGI